MYFEAPLLFLPNLRTETPDATSGYIWGKFAASSKILQRLPEQFQETEEILLFKKENSIVSERWICSDDPQRGSLVMTPQGPKPFREILDEAAAHILGPTHFMQLGGYLGCIMKQLDTNEASDRGALSVQIHPRTGHPTRPAKPEMWKGEGSIYIGWKQDMSPEAVRKIVEEGTVEQNMHIVDIAPDQFVMAGSLIHAIRANTFVAEWSSAPGQKDIAKGSLEATTVALWDRTDGKQPRPGKEDVEGVLEVMQHAETFGATNPEDLYHIPTRLQLDGDGNLLRKLFTTEEVHVDEYTLVTSIPLSLEQGGLPLYVEQGILQIEQAGKLLAELPAGSECFLPYALGKVDLKAIGAAPVVVQTWYVPLEGVTRRI